MAPSNYRLMVNHSRIGLSWRVVKGRFCQAGTEMRKKFVIEWVVAEFKTKEEGVKYLKSFKVSSV